MSFFHENNIFEERKSYFVTFQNFRKIVTTLRWLPTSWNCQILILNTDVRHINDYMRRRFKMVTKTLNQFISQTSSVTPQFFSIKILLYRCFIDSNFFKKKIDFCNLCDFFFSKNGFLAL